MPDTPKPIDVDVRGLTLYSSAWNTSRHELIASASQKLLQDKTAILNRIWAILDPLKTRDLADIAGWADEIKRRKPTADDDPDTVTFLQDERNKRSDTWHFVDLPLNCDKYSRSDFPEFTSDSDIVQMIHLAVNSLAGNSNRFSRLNALRLVVHLVGDLHQPLHVACGYLHEGDGTAEIVRDPEVIKSESLKSDRGGNRLLLPLGPNSPNLHSYWDGKLGGDITITTFGSSEPVMNEEIIRVAKAASYQVTSLVATPAQTEIEAWATESLLAAREAYRNIEIDAAEHAGFRVQWEGKSSYDSRCSPILQGRLTAAARNLAGLLAEVLQK